MAVIEKKTWPEEFQAINDGKKKFDLRLNDFEVRPGDTLVLREYDPSRAGSDAYTGRVIEKKVSYVFKFKPEELRWYSPEDVEERGLQILSLE